MQDESDSQKKLKALRALQHEKEAKRELLRRELEELDAEIVGIKLRYAQTCNEQLPIFALPKELLLIIFKNAYSSARFSLPDIHEADCCDQERSHDAHRECQGCLSVEMDISQVCHSWRALALGRPDFWSTFNFRGRAWNFDPDLRLSMYLERSRQRPLDIRLDVPADLHFEIPFMTAMLLPHAARWRHFSLRYDSSKNPMKFLDSMEPISAESLETFEISTYTKPSREWPPSRLRTQDRRLGTIFKGGAAPKLTSLRMSNAMWEACLPQFSNLTVLQIDSPQDRVPVGMKMETFLSILRIPTLTSLSLSQMRVFRFYQSRLCVVAPNLRHLRCFDHEVFSFIWKLLKAPLLELLILRSMDIGPGWSFPNENPGDGPACEHFPSLKTICFINCCVDDHATFTGITQATSSVIHLIICNGVREYRTTEVDVFLHMLNSGDTIYWPNLKTVSYSPYKYIRMPENVLSANVVQLTDMLTNRAVKLHTQCTYQIWDSDLNRLMQADEPAGDLWRSIQKGEFHDIVTKDVEDPMDWSPWPARLHTEFRRSSELPFSPYLKAPIWYFD